jgi:glycosyltransferase involved in cell wall biosynthesis
MISVLIAAYNAAAYIRESVDSALAQDDAPIEIVVADDGSTDGTVSILRSYGPRITCIAAPHANASVARNNAWRASTGEFIVVLDADDRLRPGAFGPKLQLLAREPSVGVAYGDAMTIDESGSVTGPLLCPRRLTPDDNPLEALLAGNIFPVHAALTRRSAIERLPYLYHEVIDLVGDWDLWIRLAGVTRFAYAGDMSVEYRRHAAMTTKTIESAKGLRQMLNTLTRAFEVRGVEELPARVRAAALNRMMLLALRLGSPEDITSVARLRSDVTGASVTNRALSAMAAMPGAAALAGHAINATLRARRRVTPGLPQRRPSS